MASNSFIRVLATLGLVVSHSQTVAKVAFQDDPEMIPMLGDIVAQANHALKKWPGQNLTPKEVKKVHATLKRFEAAYRCFSVPAFWSFVLAVVGDLSGRITDAGRKAMLGDIIGGMALVYARIDPDKKATADATEASAAVAIWDQIFSDSFGG